MRSYQASTSSFEHVSLWCRWLLTSLRHEGFGCESIQFGEPCRDVGDDWFDEHSSPSAAHSDAVPVEPELAGQPHGLASPVLEQLGSGTHNSLTWSIPEVYTLQCSGSIRIGGRKE